MGRRRRDEGGAILPLVALLMTLMLITAAFAVDLGMQRVARRDMQGLADAVALDLARLIDGRSAAQIHTPSPGDDQPALATRLAQSVDRNDDETLGDAPTVEAVLTTLDARGDVVRNAAGAVVEATGSTVPTAVHVTARTAVDFAFTTGRGGAARSAVGQSESTACFQLGSFAAAVSSGNSAVLDRYVSDALGVSVAGYDGLANASVTLRDLAAELGAGSVDSLLALDGVSLGQLFLASATVLSRNGGEAADVNLLNQLAANVDSTLAVDVERVLGASTGGDAALGASANLLDLVGMAAFIANGTNFLDVPVMWSVPQFSSGMARLQVIETARRACGRINEAVASTAQLRMEVRPTMNVPTIAGLAADPVLVALVADLAPATGTLTAITCGDGTVASPESISVRVERSGVSTLDLAIPIRLAGEIKASDIVLDPSLFGLSDLLGSLVGLKATVDITVDAGASVTYPQSTVDGTYAVPPRTYADMETLGGGQVALPLVTLESSDFSGTITVNGVTRNLTDLALGTDVDLSPITDDLVSKNVLTGINGFIDNVNAELAGLTELLGIETAGADLLALRRPTCNSPVLRG